MIHFIITWQDQRRVLYCYYFLIRAVVQLKWTLRTPRAGWRRGASWVTSDAAKRCVGKDKAWLARVSRFACFSFSGCISYACLFVCLQVCCLMCCCLDDNSPLCVNHHHTVLEYARAARIVGLDQGRSLWQTVQQQSWAGLLNMQLFCSACTT